MNMARQVPQLSESLSTFLIQNVSSLEVIGPICLSVPRSCECEKK